MKGVVRNSLINTSQNNLQPSDAKTVAVVTPIYNRNYFTPDEEISFSHLEHYLGRYDKYLIAPESLEIDRPGYKIKRFSDRFFGSLVAHTALMLNPMVYEAFREYQFILIYQTDALVFSDKLLDWCAMDFDLIAGPIKLWDDLPLTVGNGGFALKKVESYLKVFRSPEYAVDPGTYWRSISAGKSIPQRLLQLPKKYLKRLHYFNNIDREVALFLRMTDAPWEDIFICTYANKYYPGFKFAPLEPAYRFAFDEMPRYCYEVTGGELPFGCHGWFKHDREFWEPYLLNWTRE
jgi:hypothetical protein